MRLTPGTEPMGLPPYIKMGMELEVENVNGRKVAESIEQLDD